MPPLIHIFCSKKKIKANIVAEITTLRRHLQAYHPVR